MDVEVTRLPGIGTKQEITTTSGRRLGVLTHRDGHRELLVSAQADLDTSCALAVFFVVFGLNTDPAQVPAVLPAALVLAVVSTATKLGAGWFAARQIGVGPLGRWRAGAALVARGEFSIVIAGLALTTGAVDPGLAPLATTYVLLMAILGPVAARVVEPVHAGVTRRLRPAAS